MKNLTRYSSLIVVFLAVFVGLAAAQTAPTTPTMPPNEIPAIGGVSLEDATNFTGCRIDAYDGWAHAYAEEIVSGKRVELSYSFKMDDLGWMWDLQVNGTPRTKPGQKIRTFPQCDLGFRYRNFQAGLNGFDANSRSSVYGWSSLHDVLLSGTPIVITMRPGWKEVFISFPLPPGKTADQLVLSFQGSLYYYDKYRGGFVFWADASDPESEYVIHNVANAAEIYHRGTIRYGKVESNQTSAGSYVGIEYSHGLQKVVFDPRSLSAFYQEVKYSTLVMVGGGQERLAKMFMIQLPSLSMKPSISAHGFFGTMFVFNVNKEGKRELIGYGQSDASGYIGSNVPAGYQNILVVLVDDGVDTHPLQFSLWFGLEPSTSGGGGGKG